MSLRARIDALADFVETRTGAKRLLSHALDEPIAGGARWAYVFGSMLTAVFGLQAVTGLLLMSAYSPSTQTAWASVHHVTYVTQGGWLVRGLHHFGAQAMIVLLGMHLFQVALFGAYKRPREVNWWFGLLLLGATLAFSLTGYLLPWDQKGYWATRVATNIAGTIPVVGASQQALIQGGSDYSSLTLTRFYALHVGVLPAALIGALVAHIALFRKHGVTPPHGADLTRKDLFFPRQLWKDVQAAIVVFGVIVYFAFRHHGAPLDAPADPASDYPARPEWYFLSLFELLKYFHGPLELLGTVVLPGLAGAYLFLLPLLDRKESLRARDRVLPLLPLFGLGVAVVVLTVMALRHDARDEKFQAARRRADLSAAKALALAAKGIPPEGPLAMMTADPEVLGEALFTKHCQGCHVLGDLGSREEASAPVLDGWGSEAWVLSMLDDPDHDARFGRTPYKGMMPSMTRCKPDDASCKPMKPEDARSVAAFLAAGADDGAPPPTDAVRRDAARVRSGEAIVKTRCTTCHLYKGEGDDGGEGTAPELSGWGSRAWIRAQVMNPASKATYREKALAPGMKKYMPAFEGELKPAEADVLAAWVHQRARR